jgi:AGCS family alanine or glycine:cation symporter
MKAQLAWDISDTFNGMMMIPNLIGVLVLSPQVMKCTKNYVDRRIHGKEIKPMLSMIPEIQAQEEKLIHEDDTDDCSEYASCNISVN